MYIACHSPNLDDGSSHPTPSNSINFSLTNTKHMGHISSIMSGGVSALTHFVFS